MFDIFLSIFAFLHAQKMVFFNIFSFFNQNSFQKAWWTRDLKILCRPSCVRAEKAPPGKSAHHVPNKKHPCPLGWRQKKRFKLLVFSAFYIIILASSIFNTILPALFFVIPLNQKEPFLSSDYLSSNNAGAREKSIQKRFCVRRKACSSALFYAIAHSIVNRRRKYFFRKKHKKNKRRKSRREKHIFSRFCVKIENFANNYLLLSAK